ncbi:MAG: LysR family transcriptional regulator [Alphaproteobacteria bacterium]|nr:LysR family transcriptional regulator [Alphaproteobacteria bacterium]MCB9693461.1 LysR family transcriptional regulator [Alphaproteobacteria bacterium]
MRDLSSVDLNLLVTLDLLLETRSVREAARRAHVTPSAMSHTLGRLRDLLGDPVLVRAGRGMVATARAEALAEPVRAVLADASRVLAPASFDPAALTRRFRLVSTDHVSTILVGDLEARLTREAPGVDLDVVPLQPETLEELRRGGVDAAIGVFPDAPPELRATALFDDRFVTVCRVDHPRVGPDLPLDRYLTERHLLVSPRGTPVGRVDRELAAMGSTRRVALTFPSFLSALWHVPQSDALLTVSARLVAAVRPRIPVQVLATPLDLPRYTLVLLWAPRLEGSPEDAWFRSLVRSVAAGLGPIG